MRTTAAERNLRRADKLHEAALAAQSAGRFTDARRDFVGTLKLLREPVDVANVLISLSAVDVERADYPGALRSARQAEKITRRFRSPLELVRLRVAAIGQLATVYRVRAKYRDA